MRFEESHSFEEFFLRGNNRLLNPREQVCADSKVLEDVDNKITNKKNPNTPNSAYKAFKNKPTVDQLFNIGLDVINQMPRYKPINYEIDAILQKVTTIQSSFLGKASNKSEETSLLQKTCSLTDTESNDRIKKMYGGNEDTETPCDLNSDCDDRSITQLKTKDSPRKKKKRKRSLITICLTNCRYDAIRKVAAAFGMKEVSEEDAWNFYWTDLSVSVERVKEMKRFQRINHFPGMLEICRKDLLARNLNRMQKIYPKEYNFFPKTWCFPADFGDALNYSKLKKNKTFIIKPECGSQGRGIYLTRSLKEVKPSDKLICQLYISKPFLVDGYKFDIRVYTLITSCDPLRVFVYNEGLVRFATSRYADPNIHNTTNVFMHLTNYAVNKHSRTYIHDNEAGSKRKISTLNRHLLTLGVDVERLWHSIDQVIVKTIISAWPILKHSYHACFPSHDMVHASFELLGFDILLDHRLHPYILEVNHSPSFHTDTQLDREVKEALLTDTFTMLNIRQCDKRRILEEDRKRIRDRLLQGTQRNIYSPIQDDKDGQKEKSPWQIQIQWEETHLGNYRRVYPVGDRYASLFQQPSGSLYLGTVSSRARGDCTKIQREEILQTKAKLEALKKPPDTANPCQKKMKQSSETKLDKLEKDKKRRPFAPVKHFAMSCSFKPDPIIEAEERERLSQLAQRDFLIRSYGMLEQIYLAMKKNGTLRAEDERKYGAYGRLAAVPSHGCKMPEEMDNTQIEVISKIKDLRVTGPETTVLIRGAALEPSESQLHRQNTDKRIVRS